MNKQKLIKLLKSKNLVGKIICVDLDNTLCKGTYWLGDKEHPPVNEKMADYVRSLDDRGAFIIIWTARPLKALTKTYRWLGANNLQYPIALRIKPPADLYIDDKALNVDDIKFDK
jgi:hypothetical protein